MKTVDPEVPDFASERFPLHKFAGMCIKSQYQRFFTVDSENLKYYKDKQNQNLQKALDLKDSEALLQQKASFYAD